MSRENFNLVVNAEEYGFESSETPRTDKLVNALDLIWTEWAQGLRLTSVHFCFSFVDEKFRFQEI